MKLQAAYAGDKAKEITNREAEVVNAWLNLQGLCDARKGKLADTGDLFKFFNMCRILMLWMDDVNRQMNTTEKPRCGDDLDFCGKTLRHRAKVSLECLSSFLGFFAAL